MFWIRLFYALLFLCAAFVVFDLCTRRYLNPWKLYLVFGKKGSGKSTYLVKQALKLRKKGFVIYSNMPDLSIPHARYIDPEQLGDYVPESDSVLILDEVGMIYDNRNFKSFKNSTRDFYKLQRHYRVIVFMASQTFDVDKKIRDLTDSMVLQSNFMRVFSLSRPIRRITTLTEPTGDQESRLTESLKFAPIWDWKLTFIPRYAKFFDTAIVPDRPKLRYVEVPPLPDKDLDPLFLRARIWIHDHLPKLPHRVQDLPEDAAAYLRDPDEFPYDELNHNSE